MEPILLFTGASKYTLGYAVDYLSIYLLGTLFVEISTGLNAFINAQGRPSIAMCSVLIGALLNIVLDPIFIFWLDMGVKGAALATILSQACSAIWVLSFLFSRRASLPLERRYMRLDRRIVLSMFALGISPFIMASTESLVGFVLNSSLKNFGDIYVSALAILQSAMQFASVPLTGFAQGFVPIISYNYVQLEKPEEAFKEIEKLAAKYPMEARYQIVLGDLHLENGEMDKALACYQKANEIDPTDPYYIVQQEKVDMFATAA